MDGFSVQPSILADPVNIQFLTERYGIDDPVGHGRLRYYGFVLIEGSVELTRAREIVCVMKRSIYY